LDDFSVGANIALAIELQGRKATNEEVNKILQTLDLDGYGSRRTNELSGGQKQRIAIARALVKNPDIILADEPTGALDSKTGLQIFEILKKLSKEKLVLVVSHDREFAESFGDRVIELADGQIISDISKTAIKKDLDSVNVQYDKKEGLIVKEGYQLTVDDLALINKYLLSEKNLSITTKKSDQLHIQEVFVETPKKAGPKVYVDEFKMIKSRLPSRMAFVMGASGLNHKKFRLFMTIVLSLVAFGLFGVADSLAAYNRVDATVNSIIDGKITSVALSKRKTIEDEMSNYPRQLDLSLAKSDIEYLNSSIGKETELAFKPIFAAGARGSQSPFYIGSNYSPSNNLTYNSYYLDAISGLAEFTSEELTSLGYTLLGNSRLPTNDDEIAVTKYIFEHFAAKGYSIAEEGTLPIDIKADNLNNPSDLIGKYIFLNSNNLPGSLKLKVVGVVDTHFETERYEELKTSITELANYFLLQEFTTTVNYGYHGLGFVNPGYIDTLIALQDTTGIEIGKNAYLHYYTEDSNMYFAANNINILENYETDQLFFFGEQKTCLAKNEIIVAASSFINNDATEYTIGDFTGTLQQYENALMNDLIMDYAITNYLVAESRGFYEAFYRDIVLSTEEKINGYFEYLYYGRGYQENHYGDKSGDEFYMEVLEQFRPIFESFSPIAVIKEYYNFLFYRQDTGDATIVGFLKDTNDYYEYSTMIVDDDLYEDIALYEKIEPYKYALAKMPSNRAAIKKIAQFCLTMSEDSIESPLQNSATPMLEMANDLVESVAALFIYIGLGFAIFSALMLSNFIGSSVAYKKREIGILRAVGARSSDVFRIFFNESALVALINFVLASIATYMAVYYINASLRTDIGLSITIFNFSVRQIALLLLISFFVAFVASFLPVYRIARKKPVDAISNK
ncbi:MAG: FtsX-like permease family protein, partial [Erysipelotrichia bacterium]|nr:FtsX-like permease family protein [Erysipelotrichia bacterium]